MDSGFVQRGLQTDTTINNGEKLNTFRCTASAFVHVFPSKFFQNDFTIDKSALGPNWPTLPDSAGAYPGFSFPTPPRVGWGEYKSVCNVPHTADFHLVTGEYSHESCFDAYQRALNNANALAHSSSLQTREKSHFVGVA